MPTKAITKKAPLNIAEKAVTHPILAFNQEGKIDVFLFDNTDPLADSLGLDRSLQIPLSELANGNILCQISQQLDLMPGENEKDDAAIISHLKSKISDNISNPEQAVVEILTSWKQIASHPLFIRYAAFKTSKEQTSLAFIGAYEASLHDYIAGYLRTLTQHNRIETWVFQQAAEIVKSTFTGRSFNNNPYYKLNTLITLAEECTQDIPDSKKTIDNVKDRLEREQGGWYITLGGLIGFEIQSALEDGELEAEELKSTLRKILAGKTQDLTQSEEIAGNFEQTIKLLKNPKDPSFYDRLEVKPTETQIRQAIVYIIEKNILEKKYSLENPQAAANKDLLSLARSRQETDAQALLIALLDENQLVSSMLLECIARISNNETVKAVASRLLEEQQKDKHQDVGIKSQPRFTAIYDSQSKEVKDSKSGKRPTVEIVIESDEEDKDKSKEKKKKVEIK